MVLAKSIYQVTDSFPKKEIYGITSQMRRSAVSVPSNIAEGSMRRHNKEYKQFLYIALGSLAELETQVLLSEELDSYKVHLRIYPLHFIRSQGVLFLGLSIITPALLSRANTRPDLKAGLHPSWKRARVNALLQINLTIRAGLSRLVTFGQPQKQDPLTPKFQISLARFFKELWRDGYTSQHN